MMLKDTRDKALVNAFWMYGNGQITKQVFLETVEKLKYNMVSPKKEVELRDVIVWQVSVPNDDDKHFIVLNGNMQTPMKQKFKIFYDDMVDFSGRSPDDDSEYEFGGDYDDEDDEEADDTEEVATSEAKDEPEEPDHPIVKLEKPICTIVIPYNMFVKLSGLLHWGWSNSSWDDRNSVMVFKTKEDIIKFFTLSATKTETRVNASVANVKLFRNVIGKFDKGLKEEVVHEG